ncbi:MAG: type II/IV secretion system protein [Candidatus Chaera renei]|uniref:Type II/IV secretion system protein n=1 Tax=Candidatus Chaera renei TaxID=2506947 RepID=A0A4V1J7M7_9BACT|nr:MAG: type II/IV secretion system protein [Candidatus Chaera renei]
MAILTDGTQGKLEELLLSEKILTPAELKKHRQNALSSGKPLIAELVESGAISNEVLTRCIASVSNVPYVNLQKAQVNQDVLKLLPRDIAERFMAVPLGEVQNRLAVAMLDANNVQAVDYLANKIQRPLKVYLASEEGIRNVLEQYKTDLEEGLSAAITSVKNEESAARQAVGEANSLVIKQDSPISRALNTILEYAVKNRASDVHIEPLEDSLKIRCRIDGVLREIMKLPKGIEPALISRIKILSNLKIDEHRIPQDGQFAVRSVGKDVDLRIAVSPVVWGEQVVIRLLDKSGSSFKLEEMGYAGRALRNIRKGIRKPNGMILTSGPTGSGKSTSLYALIQEIKDDKVNIVTLEDPVEYKMPGVNQIQVNTDVGLTFASGLRSILRQDPDIVMVGEIRDGETANLAVQAALTGHLVFSTLHTNSAAGVLPRLLDMGIEPFLIASTVNTVIGQRLVRRVADERDTYQSSALEAQSIHETIGHLLPKTKQDVAAVSEDLGYKDLPLSGQNAYTLVKGKDTPQSPEGFKGRVGLFEVMDITEEIQNLIVKRSTSAEIQKQAIAQGMITMRQDGYMKALQGVTTLGEVNRVAANMA